MANFRNIVISSSGTGGTLVWPTGTLAMGGLILTGAGAINGITLSGTAATFTLATNAAVTLTGPVQVSFSGFGTLDTLISVSKTLTLAAADNYTLTATASGNVYVSGGTDVAVADGGTGRSTGTTAYALVATGTTATGAQQTLASGATTEVLVGGGASALPVWTTATGSGAPVRATSPALTTPIFTNGGYISDGTNELLKFTVTASAVNELTLANAATGGSPSFTASGGDTNISINLVPKGTGGVLIPNGALATPAIAFASDTDTGFYREASNEMRVGAGGVAVCKFSYNGTTTFFGPASSPIARDNSTGEQYFAMQAYRGAHWGVRLGDAATKAYIRAGNATPTANILEVQNSAGTAQTGVDTKFGLFMPKTITAALTTGNATIDKPSGSVNFAAGNSSLVVTNALVTTSSVIQCTVATNDATATFAKVVAASGSFTIYITAATAETRVNFLVTN